MANVSLAVGSVMDKTTVEIVQMNKRASVEHVCNKNITYYITVINNYLKFCITVFPRIDAALE